jgi:hypothetical protein
MRATWLAIFRSHSMVCVLASGVHRMGVPADVRDGVLFLRVLRDGGPHSLARGEYMTGFG